MLRHNIQRADHTCNYCKRTFTTAGGVCQHIAHSVQCQEQWEVDVQYACRAPGSQDAEHSDMDDIFKGIDLPDEGNDINMGDHAPVHFNAPGGHEDRVAELREDESTESTVEDEDHFPCFAEEFSAHAAADILGRDVTPFEQMRLYQDGSGGGMYTPFADRDEWELAQWLVKNVNQRATEEFLKLPIVSVGSFRLFMGLLTYPGQDKMSNSAILPKQLHVLETHG